MGCGGVVVVPIVVPPPNGRGKEMRIAIADYLEINPKTNRGRNKRWTEYEATTEAEARKMHQARIDSGELEPGVKDGGWCHVR